MPTCYRRLALCVGTIVPVLAVLPCARAQMGPTPGLSPALLNQPNGPAKLDGNGNASAFNVIPLGGTVPRPLSAISADRLNLKSYGAVGNAQSAALTVTIAAGSKALTVATAAFSAADVGKLIDVPGAGAAGGVLTGVTIAAYAAPTAVTLSAPAVTALAAAPQTITWGADDSPALAAAVTAANMRLAAGGTVCLYGPAASYLIGNGAAIPGFATGKPGCIAGDGPNQTRFFLSASFTGDLFAWSEAWIGAGNTPGARASDFAVYGSPAAPGQQNALMFYDREDQVLVADVDVWNLPGRAIYSGVLKNTSQSYMRESHLRGLRVFNSGTAALPAVEFSAEGGAGTDGSNEISIAQIDIYGSPGRAFVIRNDSQGVVRNFKIDALRTEGLNNNTTNVGDLVTIGDPVMTGQVANLQFTNFEALWVPNTSYAVRFTAPSPGSQPYNVTMTGLIGNGPGGGVRVDAGRSLQLTFSGIATAGTNVTVGSSALVGANIEINGNGAEKGWTYSVDPASVSSVVSRIHNVGVPSTVAFVPCANGTVPPMAPGANATDLQCLRAASLYTATGPQSTISGGESNKATNTDATVMGGANNAATGFRSTVAGGAFNTSFGQYSYSSGLNNLADGNFALAEGNGAVTRATNGKRAFAGGSFAVAGDAQRGAVLLRAATSSTAATRLTSDGLPPNTGNSSNVVNIPAGTLYHLSVSATCRDTTNGNWAIWNGADGVLARPAAGAVTYAGAYSSSTTPNLSSGAGATATLTLGADTTNNGLSASVAMPNANAWHCVADARTPEEVQ